MAEETAFLRFSRLWLPARQWTGSALGFDEVRTASGIPPQP